MQLFIKQDLDSLREDLGYDGFDDEDDEALLFQQGFDGDAIEVEDGEEFEIPEGYSANIIDAEEYLIQVELFDDVCENVAIEDDLPSGRYVLEGNIVKRII